MNNKIELLKAMINKPIKVEIKDNLSLVSNRYIYSVDTDSCVVTSVVTREYVSEYIKATDRDSNFKAIKYADINGIRITVNDVDYDDVDYDVDYEDIYDNIDDYEYAYNHINRSDL